MDLSSSIRTHCSCHATLVACNQGPTHLWIVFHGHIIGNMQPSRPSPCTLYYAQIWQAFDGVETGLSRPSCRWSSQSRERDGDFLDKGPGNRHLPLRLVPCNVQCPMPVLSPERFQSSYAPAHQCLREPAQSSKHLPQLVQPRTRHNTPFPKAFNTISYISCYVIGW